MDFFSSSSITETLASTWDRFSGAVVSVNSFKDIIDILFVAVIVYALIIQMRKTQSIQILKGLALVAVLYLFVNLFEMNASKFIFSNVIGDLLITNQLLYH